MSGWTNFPLAIVLWGAAVIIFAAVVAHTIWRWRGFNRGGRVIFKDPDGRRWRYDEIANMSDDELARLMEQRPDVWKAYGQAISDAMGPPGRVGQRWRKP